ncbi:MAG TPA: hypothetical protein VMM56_09320 [Planctomycetaceae bacterium]|nr:hypothetical protein [Planctomycetaceae bacterium]
MSFLEELKFSTSQVEAKPGKLDRFGTTFGKNPDFGLFHHSMLRGGADFLTQSRGDAKTREGRRRHSELEIRATIAWKLNIGHGTWDLHFMFRIPIHSVLLGFVAQLVHWRGQIWKPIFEHQNPPRSVRGLKLGVTHLAFDRTL